MSIFSNIPYKNKQELQRALELLEEGDWQKAHEIAQTLEGNPAYDRIHAVVHRMEGDSFNTRYWYRRLGLEVPSLTFKEEITILKKELNT